MRSLTKEQFREFMIEAGIYTPDGQLSERYQKK